MSDMPHRDFERSMIQKPGRTLLRNIPLGYVRSLVSAGNGRALCASLNLTSFVDFLIVVVVFLLMTFSASGASSSYPAMKVPSAENALPVLDAPVVAVMGNEVLLDGVSAGSTRSIEEAGRLQRIDELHSQLKAKRELWKQINPERGFPGVVLLQIDKRVPALVAKSVLQTAAQAGYPNASFMVGQLPKTSSPALSGDQHI
jgi:biopolymer transport protein ExbD